MSLDAGLKAVCFDLDGTLIPSTTVSMHLAEWLGHGPTLEQLESAYAKGAISNREVADRSAGHFTGVPKSDVWPQLESVPLIDGIDETLRWLRDNSIHAVITTVTWRFAAEYFAGRFGFDAVCGCTLAADKDGILLGRVEQHFESESKISFVEDFARQRGFGLARCAAVGDGASDVALFGAVGFSIALNATPAAQAAASVTIDTDDLGDIIPALAGAHSASSSGVSSN